MKDFLKDLGLEPGQHTPDAVKAAWRAKCKETHPDTGGSGEAFKKVMHAYNMLTNPAYREEQDNHAETKKADLNIRMQVPINFNQAFFGCTFSLSFNREKMDELGNTVKEDFYEIENLKVEVPPGCCAGYQMGYPGKGYTRGEERGVVELNVIVQPHPKFKVDHEGNIVCVEKIPLDLMVKGGIMEVQTMFGLRGLQLRPGTVPGAKIALKKLGCAGADHIVVCDPLFPTPEDLKKEAWKGLDINWELDEKIKKEKEEEAKWYKTFRGNSNARFVFTHGGGTGTTGGF